MSNSTNQPNKGDPSRRAQRSDRRSARSQKSKNQPSHHKRERKPVQPPEGEDLVLVRFKGNRKGYYNNSRNIPITVGHYCLVEADRGRDMGRVSYIGPGKVAWWQDAIKQSVLEIAKPSDLERLYQNRGDEWEFWDICQEKIQSCRLKMNLVSVERQFDHNKITFYFTAEKRVDFRELVRDLAAIFRTRIELRQIGVRDEARLKGGVGICGREFCCSTYLHEFIPVTLKMAKDQQLPLNPNKLSGLCGRLRCCLTFEHNGYQQALQQLPSIGSLVTTGELKGTVRKLDLVRERVFIQLLDENQIVVRQSSELSWEKQNRQKQNPPAGFSRQHTKKSSAPPQPPQSGAQPQQHSAPSAGKSPEQPAKTRPDPGDKRRSRRRRRGGGRR